MSTDPPRSAMPGTLRWAVWLLAGEAAAVTAFSAYLIYEDIAGQAASLRSALLVTAYALLMAGLLSLLARSLSRRRAWARSPAIVLQLLLLPTAYVMISSGLIWLGLPIGVLGLVVIGLLVSPATRQAIGIR